MKISKKGLIVYFLLQCMSISQMLFSAQQHLSFDKLYPENWYTRARDYCMKVWGNIEDLLQNKKNTKASNYVIDASIGQLVFAKYCVHNIIQHKCAVGSDDLMHLSRIIGTIEDRYAKLSTAIILEKREFLHYVIQQLKHKMGLLFQANNAITSSRH